MGGTVGRRRIHEQEDWAPKELRGNVGSAKLARHEVNMCRAPLCSSPDFTVGQQAFVKAKFFQTTRPSHKLSKKFLGPFEILAKASTHSFTLRLPKTICSVHPIFHVSMLEPTTPNEIPNCVQSPPPPVDVQGD